MKGGAPADRTGLLGRLAVRLRAHETIAFSSLMPNRQWRFADKAGNASVTITPRFEINDAVAAVAAAEAGDGITIEPWDYRYYMEKVQFTRRQRELNCFRRSQ